MKRFLVYVALAVVFAIAVVVKIGIIKEKEAATIVSILGEWQRDGVPVEVYEVTQKDLLRTEKLTGEVKSPRLLNAIVSSSLARSLSRGDSVTLPDVNGTVQGAVTAVTRDADATGLYRVAIAVKAPLKTAIGSTVAVDVEVGRIPRVLAVPSSALKSEDGKTYVWKLVDGSAVRSEVQRGEQSQGMVQITRGVKEGDLVVARGQSNLEEGLGVQIISTL